MKTKTESDNTAGAVTPAASCSSLEVANAMIRQQEYMLYRQHEMIEGAIRRNAELVKAANQCERENHKLRKELEGYKKGRIWTMICSFLPTTTFGDDRF